MLKKTAIITFIIFAATVATSAAQQQPSAGGHHPQGQSMGTQQQSDQTLMPPWIRNLPPEQQKQFQQIFETRTRTIYPLVFQVRAKQAQLMADLSQENVNRRQVDQTLKQINDLQAQLTRAHVDLMLEVKQTLPQVFMHFMMKGPGMGVGMMGCPGMGMMGGPGMGMMGGGHGMGTMGGWQNPGVFSGETEVDGHP